VKAVILAAGRGERLVPFTETRPKHMLPIAGEPILSHLLRAVHSAGIREAVLVVGYRMDAIKGFFGDGSRWGLKLHYVEQKRQRGTGDALACVEAQLHSEPSLVIYGDLLLAPEAITSVLEKYEKTRTTIIGATRVEDVRQYGLLSVDDDRVIELEEKPKVRSAGLVNAGIYVFGDEISSALASLGSSPRGEVELTDAVRLLIRRGIPMKAVELPHDSWMDIGRPWDMLEANEYLLDRMEHTVRGDLEEGARVKGPVTIGDGARVLSGAYVEGPCLIGANSLIGPNCYIRPFTSTGKGVRIGNGCEIKNSIIMDGTHIGHLSYVGDSVVGQRCNLGAGTKVANLRFDDAPVKVRIKGKLEDSGRRKLGAFLGDGVKTGLNASIMPGVKVSHDAWIGPNVILCEDVKPSSFVYSKQRLRRRLTRAS